MKSDTGSINMIEHDGHRWVDTDGSNFEKSSIDVGDSTMSVINIDGNGRFL